MELVAVMEPRKRKRGIKASRAKLEVAMLAKGFETQAALAQQIALDENLSKSPKDLVNKAFREQAVSTLNLARIANALDVEAHTIYLAQNDKSYVDVADKQAAAAINTHIHDEHISVTKQKNTEDSYKSTVQIFTILPLNLSKWQVLVASAAMLVTALFVWGIFSADNSNIKQPAVFSTKVETSLGKVLLIVQSPETSKALAQSVIGGFVAENRINATLATSPNAYEMGYEEVFAKWQAHLVLRFIVEKGEFYQLLQVDVASQYHNATLFQAVLRPTELTATKQKITDNITAQINKFVAGQPLASILTPSLATLSNLLEGKELLFTSHIENELNLAKQPFLASLNTDEQFVPALAELCRIYVRESWIKDETASLEKAATYCEQGNKISPNNIGLISAQAELLSRTGDVKKALALGEKFIPLNTKDADALAVMAELYLVLSGVQNEQSEILSNQIVNYATEAIQLAPTHWRAHNTLGNYFFSHGDILTAKNYFAAASKLVKQDVILSNLGTMQMCFDELADAQQTYSELITVASSNYLGYENLGSVYMFQHKYELALSHKLTAIEKQPEVSIHQVWASLAEVYLRLEQNPQAYRFYTKALIQLERDELLENTTVSDQLFKLYYQAKLNQLSTSDKQLANLTERVAQFINDINRLGLKARAHLAWLANYAGNSSAKREIWAQIRNTCPVYSRSPELVFD